MLRQLLWWEGWRLIWCEQDWVVYVCCVVLHKSLQSCPALGDPMDCSLPGSSVHVNSPGKNTGMICHSLPQGILPAQGPSPHLLWLLHWQSGFFFFYISATWVVYRFTYLWKEEAHSLIPMWPFIRMIFCYSLRVVTRLGCQFSCLATARFWIIACLHHWGARAQQVESAGQCTSRRKCCEEILMMLFSVWWRVWGHCQWILRQGVCTHCY